jgi:hypothetical protein
MKNRKAQREVFNSKPATRNGQILYRSQSH